MAIELLEKIEDFFLKLLRKIKLGFLADIYEKGREAWRYIIFGALATFVNIGMYALCAMVFFKGLPEAQRVDFSNYIAIGSAMAFAYITNKLFVFDSKTHGIKELLKEIVSFVGCRIFSAAVEIVFMRITVVNLHFNEVLMKICANVIVMILNYVFSKLIIFKNKSKDNDNLDKHQERTLDDEKENT